MATWRGKWEVEWVITGAHVICRLRTHVRLNTDDGKSTTSIYSNKDIWRLCFFRRPCSAVRASAIYKWHELLCGWWPLRQLRALGTTLVDHTWGPHLWTTLGTTFGTTLRDQIWGQHLGTKCGGPHLKPHLGDHSWGTKFGDQIWGTSFGDHIWGTTFGGTNWDEPHLGTNWGITFVGQHLGDQIWGTTLGDHTWGDHTWGTTLGDNIWGTTLGTTFGDHTWGPHLDHLWLPCF